MIIIVIIRIKLKFVIMLIKFINNIIRRDREKGYKIDIRTKILCSKRYFR